VFVALDENIYSKKELHIASITTDARTGNVLNDVVAERAQGTKSILYDVLQDCRYSSSRTVDEERYSDMTLAVKLWHSKFCPESSSWFTFKELTSGLVFCTIYEINVNF